VAYTIVLDLEVLFGLDRCAKCDPKNRMSPRKFGCVREISERNPNAYLAQAGLLPNREQPPSLDESVPLSKTWRQFYVILELLPDTHFL
jgi:hypothetical protein